MRYGKAILPVIITTAFALASNMTFAAVPDISQYTSAKLKTLTLDSRVTQENQKELKKIEGDFANAYRFHRVSVSYVQPAKLQFESIVAGAHITYTINGNKKFTSIPTFHVHKVEDTSGSPAKRQSLLDLGLVPPELLNDMNGIFLRKENGLLVFELRPKQSSETWKDVIWLDPKTRITTKRMHYDRHGILIAWYQYKNPIITRKDIYVPSRVEVYNPQNKLGAVTIYENIKVNFAIDNSIFNF